MHTLSLSFLVLTAAALDVGAIVSSALQAAAPVVIPALFAGVVTLGAMAGRWLHAHTGTSKMAGFMMSGIDYVGTAVSHVLDGMRPKFQAALENDGKIDAAEMAELKATAIKLCMAEMPGPLKAIADNLGPAFGTWLSGKVGQAVSSQASQLQAASSPPSP